MPRPAVADRDARALARDLLEMSPEAFAAAFRGSPMKRAKLRGLRRNAAVVLGNIGGPDDVDVLVAALSDDEALVRRQAASSLAAIGTPDALAAIRAAEQLGSDPSDASRPEPEPLDGGT